MSIGERHDCDEKNPRTLRPYGHKWEFVYRYTVSIVGNESDERGVFQCTRCGQVDHFPLKQRNGDKINIRKSDRRKAA